MTVRRTLTSNATGLALRMDVGTIRVKVGDTHRVQVHLSTEDPDDSPAARAINGATITDVSPANAQVVVPPQGHDNGPTTFAGGDVYNYAGGNTTQVIQAGTVHGRIEFSSGGDIFVGGQPYSGKARAVRGVVAEIELPDMAPLRVDTETADVEHFGGPLSRVEFLSRSGSLHLQEVTAIDAETVSGSVTARSVVSAAVISASGAVTFDRARRVDVDGVSGATTVRSLNGDAHIETVSGRIAVTAVGPGNVVIKSTSSEITVLDPYDLFRRGLNVTAKTISGKLDIPR